jgi:hypothetical protein
MLGRRGSVDLRAEGSMAQAPGRRLSLAGHQSQAQSQATGRRLSLAGAQAQAQTTGRHLSLAGAGADGRVAAPGALLRRSTSVTRVQWSASTDTSQVGSSTVLYRTSLYLTVH